VEAPASAPPAPPLEPVTVEPTPVAPAAPMGRPLAGPLILRIGLLSDLGRVVLPCCEGEVSARAGLSPHDGEVVAVSSPLVVEPAAVIARRGVWRVQVAALKDEGQAQGLAARLMRESGATATATFDAQSDLYRVRVGSFAERAAAEELQRRLSTLGVDSSWVVDEGGGVGEAGFLITQGAATRRVEGRWFALSSSEAVRVEGRRYRGRILLYINDRGTINVINEVPLEEYLRGVVPRELGPRAFNQLEALKAQAVAARTYAIRTRGEFAAEGYDLCATPRCQVYGGVEDEDPLSDQAVRETAGEVLVHDGEVIDALYSSTCGGHTEDVERVFPLKRAAYLRAVPCLEAGTVPFATTAAEGTPFATDFVRRHLASAPRPPSLGRLDVVRFAAVLLGLEGELDLFVTAEDPGYFFPHPPGGWSSHDVRLAIYLLKLDLLDGPLEQPLAPRDLDRLLWRIALHRGEATEEEGTFRALAPGGFTWLTRDGERFVEFPAPAPAFRSLPPSGGTGGTLFDAAVASDLALVPSDRLRVVSVAGRPAAVVQQVYREGVVFDRTSNRSSWTRRHSLAALRASVRTRYPGFDFTGFEVLDRGRSGRVSRLRLLEASGASIDVEGLAIRWTLDLPDSWFAVQRLAGPSGGDPTWLFRGRGWGHGVGLCQVGAFGMALRGRTYDEILRHYYSGAAIEKVPGH
jgi:stage II sporulation protein D